jgi:hypothetical protein
MEASLMFLSSRYNTKSYIEKTNGLWLSRQGVRSWT